MSGLLNPGILNRPLVEAGPTVPARVDSPRNPEIVTLSSAIFTTASVVRNSPAGGSAAWGSINDPLAFPFRLPEAETVYQLGWVNGSSAGDNMDVGIYDAAWTRLVSTGSTACVGNSSIQLVNVADTALLRDTLYYLVASRDTTTAARLIRWLTIAGVLNMVGCQSSATDAFPLPNPLTNMGAVVNFGFIPELLMAFRASPI